MVYLSHELNNRQRMYLFGNWFMVIPARSTKKSILFVVSVLYGQFGITEMI